jgi:hypothetical protein
MQLPEGNLQSDAGGQEQLFAQQDWVVSPT